MSVKGKKKESTADFSSYVNCSHIKPFTPASFQCQLTIFFLLLCVFLSCIKKKLAPDLIFDFLPS